MRTVIILSIITLIGFLTGYTNIQERKTNSETRNSNNIQLTGSVRLSAGSTVQRNIGGGYQNAYGRQNTQSSGVSESNSETQVLIWLEQSTENQPEPRLEPVVLDQKNHRFEPRLIPIIAGETVRIKNSDPVYHNVFSLSDTKKFDVGRRPQGDYKDVTFNEPGLVDVFCDIHSDMHALIVVMPRSTTTWTSRRGSGEFKFENLEVGTYRMHATALGYNSHTQTINIENSQQSIELSAIRLER